MNIRKLLPILILIPVFLAAVFGVSAQDIDVENMDNAQLLQLLQAIMQKLEQENAAGTAEQPADISAETAPSEAGPVEADRFRIYENKKLVLERIPDWYFIRKIDDGDDDNGSKKPSDPGMTIEECEKSCWDQCGFDMGCFTLCYYPKCEPVPDWVKDAGL